MTIQKEIRDRMAEIAHHWHCPSERWEERSNYLCSLGWLGPEPEYYYELVDKIILYLHSQGVVIRAEELDETYEGYRVIDSFESLIEGGDI